MSRKDIRVELPINQPDETTKLVDKILAKHIALGGSSPLTGHFDTALLTSNNSNAKTLRSDAQKADEASQSKYNQCTAKCGLAEGQNKQTKGTVYTITLTIRDVLLLKYRANPESLSDFGFDIVISTTGARRNVRVEIPDDNPEDLLDLADLIIAQDTLLGAGSPLLNEVDMAAFATLVVDAETLLNNSETQSGIKESKHNQALVLIGYAEGQTVETPDTLYWFISGIRDRLLKVYADAEEQLSEWGFNVILGEHRTGPKTNP